MNSTEFLIFKNLIHNEEYLRKVIPFIKPEYFEDNHDKILFEEINKFINKYNTLPTKEVLAIEIEKIEDLTQDSFKKIVNNISKLDDDVSNFKWAVDKTEKWCKDRAVYLALMQCVEIVDDEDTKNKLSRDAIPKILQDAIAVSFDTHIGMDYIEDVLGRFASYRLKEDRFPFDLEIFNKITDGGLLKKTLSIILAPTGAGKTLFMCHFASAYLLQGLNVLYITLEMSENKIAERIDANLMDVPINKLDQLDDKTIIKKINRIKKQTTGKLIIKEYPTKAAHSGHFRTLLNELKLKKDFIPDVIVIDYLNICASSTYKNNASIGSYSYVKAIAEEIRGLACEFDVPIISATQMNRSGFGNSDPDLTNTSESIGLPATVDLMFALIKTDELEAMNQILIKQLKNRYKEESYYNRFVIGLDRSKMRLYDVEESAQDELLVDPLETAVRKLEKEDKKNKNFGDWVYE